MTCQVHRLFEKLQRMKTYDSLYEKLGQFGYYQALLYFGLCYNAFTDGFITVGSVFTQYGQDFQCTESGIPVNKSDTRCGGTTIDQCKIRTEGVLTSCQTFNYSQDVVTDTITSDFDLVCGNEYLNAVLVICLFAGLFFGASLGGFISDNYGRKTALLMGQTVVILAVGATRFAWSWWWIALTRFLYGMFGHVCYLAMFVYIMEVIGPKTRSQAGIHVQSFFAIGYTLLSPLAMWLREWRWLQTSLAVLAVPFWFFILYIKESPRWLISKKRFDEAHIALERIAVGKDCF